MKYLLQSLVQARYLLEPRAELVEPGKRADFDGHPQFSPAKRLFHLQPPHRGAEDVGGRTKEVDVVVREIPARAGVRAHHTVGRSIPSRDWAADAADDRVVGEQLRPREPRLGAEVAHDDGVSQQQCEPRLRVAPRTNRSVAHEARRPAHAGAHQQFASAWRQFEHRRKLGAQGVRDAVHHAVDQGVDRRFRQHRLTKRGDRCQLSSPLQQLRVGLFGPGYVIGWRRIKGAERHRSAPSVPGSRVVKLERRAALAVEHNRCKGASEPDSRRW